MTIKTRKETRNYGHTRRSEKAPVRWTGVRDIGHVGHSREIVQKKKKKNLDRLFFLSFFILAATI
jgi:hypothetical protein